MRLSFLLIVSLGLMACTTDNPNFREDGAPPPADSALVEGGQIPPDGPGPTPEQGLPPDFTAPDLFSCTPDAALGCQNANKLLRCNPTGDGAVLVDCTPYACNPVHNRCNECWPDAPPYCDGPNVVTCSEAGLEKATPCPEGLCADGTCTGCDKQTYFKDADQDGHGDASAKLEACSPPPGYVASSDDCNDAAPQVHPGQQAFFGTPDQGTASFDYNCDGKEEPELSGKASCQKTPGGCTGDGWLAADPGCGKWAAWAQCQKSPMSPDCVPVLGLKQQRCR